MKRLIGVILFAGLFFCACSNDSVEDKSQNESDQADMSKNINIDVSAVYQTIQGFSASDCWTVNYVGNYWSETEKNELSRLLFSQNISDGKPDGIGLSMWRFNLGGGTAEQGDASGIADLSRRAECFLQLDGTLDFTHQAGQQDFLVRAKQFGVERFVLFSNTPPVNYTYNGKGYSARGEYANLKDEYFGDFANYITDVLVYFKTVKGIDFDYISPVNEPQYDWKEGSQEGSGWQNEEIAHLVKEIDASLSEKELETNILITEAADYEYLYTEKNGSGRSNQIEAFFNPESKNYVGNLSHVPALIGGHSYWTDSNWSDLKSKRTLLGNALTDQNLSFFQTEWSMLGDNYNDPSYPGHSSASQFDIASYMSAVIHNDLTLANASSWSFWTSLDVPRWGHKNRFLLIELIPQAGLTDDNSSLMEGGTHAASKSLWVLGNYSLFIRPGYQRVKLSIENSSNTFFGSAYISPEKDCLVVVYTNTSSKSIATGVEINGIDLSDATITKYVTSETFDLKEIVVEGTPVVDANSVTTVVYELII